MYPGIVVESKFDENLHKNCIYKNSKWFLIKIFFDLLSVVYNRIFGSELTELELRTPDII